MALIFDIETAGEDFDALDDVTRDSLTRWIRRQAADDGDRYQAMLQDLREGLGFSPLTGEIAAIGVYDTDKHQGTVFYQPQGDDEIDRFGAFTYKPMDEREMLEKFWEGARHYREFVSFNGRAFDVPFLMIRSAIRRVKASVNLMPARYAAAGRTGIRHIDLLDRLTYYGAVRRKGSLHLYCRAFGIDSPKAGGVNGDDVSALFRAGERKRIAEYNAGDLLATAELYERWREFIALYH